MSAGEDGRHNGARRPGAKTQWTKGQTGNPRGRPKKSKAPGDATVSELDMHQVIFSEAARAVTLTEGGKPITMPAFEAVVRATILSAIRGNSSAQRTFIQSAAAARELSEKRRLEAYEKALLIAVDLDHERKVWISKGKAEMDMPRHPSDLEIDHRTMSVKSWLLFTEEQLADRKKMIELRDHLLAQVPRMLEMAESDEDDILSQTGRECAFSTIRMINEKLPPRFRRSAPGEPKPLSFAETPEETWREMMRELASIFMKKAE